ncbi:glutamate-cysteine ligase family protein [Halobacteria archaeon AArc-dxtr1]|nr:glutamate-cysteine ligase family protein [Halobacteria archaeon AArc-dxtr1]
MQKSIEVEYWVIDQDGELTSPGPLVDHSDQVEEEFVEPLFELKTPPCETIHGLRTTFVDQLDDVLSRADELGKKLVPFGTPINCESIDRLPGERGRIQKAVVGSNFDFSKYCAGTHVHFEQRNVVDQLNALIALDPALALCNSSPYLQGEWVADGARAYCYRKRGYAEFPKHGQLWHYVDTVAQWHRRLERRYEEFEAAAAEAGVDDDAFADHFSPDDVVWTPVRLRTEMPTVEWRAPDATLPSQLLRLVSALDDVMEAVHHTNVRIAGGESAHSAADGGSEFVSTRTPHTAPGTSSPDRIDSGAAGISPEAITLPAFEPLCELVEAAMHDGMHSDPVVDYLERMGFPTAEFHPLSSQIDGRQFVTKADACDLRLEYADRLEEDVATLAGRSHS